MTLFLGHFKNQVEKQGKKIAIIDPDGRRFSYTELDDYSARAAEKMRTLGVKRGDTVAIVLPNGINAAAAMLAAMKVGAAFALLNPQYPKDRLDFIYQDCGAVLVITPDFFRDVKEYSPIAEEANISPDDPALLVYTSGSTGKPKGVRLDQKALRRGGERMSTAIEPVDSDILGLGAPFFFIAGLQFLLAGLERGITMVTIPTAAMRDPVLLSDLLAENEVTMCFISPKVLRYFKSKSRTLRLVIVGSERVSGAWSEDYALLNGYGSSETCGGVCFFKIDRAYDNTPVGKSVGNEAVYILDENGNEAEEGEICLAGYFADCYINLPEESAKVFIPNPFREKDGFSHLVKTGDIGKKLPDGNVVYLNRRDWMIKINGQRVEPGEIESKLRNIPGISDAAVKDFTDASGQTFLAAYYVAADCPKEEMDESVIREELQKTLPEYMIPAFYVALDKMPLNANGKLDRGALKNPDVGAKKAAYQAPENEQQKKIVEAFEEVLSLPEIGIDDDFFSLGGDSIKVMMLQQALLDRGIRVAASAVFEAHTPRTLSVSTGQVSALSEYQGHEADHYPLTHAQMSVYLDSLMPGKETAYNNAIGLFLPKETEVPRLADAVERVLNQYSVFLSSAHVIEGVPCLVPSKDVKIEAAQITTEETDLNVLAASVNTAFSLEEAPLCRAAIFPNPEGVFLVVIAHHLVSDGTSLSIVMQNIAAAYNGEALLKEDMSNLTLSLYEAEHRDETKADEEIYRGMLDNMDGNTELFADDDESLKSLSGKAGLYLTALFEQKQELSGILNAALAQNGVTESSLFMTAYVYLLGLLTGQKEVLFFVGENGRHDPVLKNTVGMMVHNIPVCVKLDEKKGSLALTKEVQELFHELVSHDNVDYAALLGEYSIRPDNFFVYQGEMFAGVTIDGRNIPMEFFDPEDAMTSLTLHVIKRIDGDYTLRFEYAAEKFKPDTVRRMADLYLQIVEGICKADKLCEISLMTDENIVELDGFNDTKADYPVTDIVSMFRAAAQSYPDKTAVLYNDVVLTYRELDAITERIAAHLVSKGIGKGSVVSILIPRCEYMPITALGVLKTGAAYQPLDPGYPTERLTLMMDDAKCNLLIADEALLDKVPEYKGEVLLLKDIPSLPESDQVENGPAPEDLFILLYTSGSTGVPKGVMLEHRNIANFVQWYQDFYEFDETCCKAAYASFGFDACMMDMYVPLTAGGTLCIVDEDVRLDLKALEDLFNRHKVTHAFMTTQVGRQFYSVANVPTLRYLSTGGEKLASLELRPEVATKLCNAYGPTECSIFSTLAVLDRHYERIPIGKPLNNYKLYVADEHMRRLPPLVPGELLIAGRGVSRGYLNRPEQTEKAFAVNPFSNEADYDRVYHTGDVVRLLADGNYDFIGRNDGQVKVRGFRIELTEVEAVIREFPEIKDATVQAFDIEGGSGKFIAAYVVSDTVIDVNALSDFIAERKPYYMVPAVMMQIERIPLNQNQKVNKKELPKPVLKAMEIVPPANDTERSLLDICTKIVHFGEFGVTVPLEEIGFTSLSYIELASKIFNTLGVELKLSELMAGGATVRSLADLISKSEVTKEKIQERKDRYPLAPQQYAHMIKSPGTDMYREFLFTDQWQDAEAIREAFVRIINCFPYLYTTFRQEDGEWYQIPYRGEMIAEADIPIIEKEPTEDDIYDLCMPYDIATADRLFDVTIFKGEKVIVLLHVHHVLMDHVFVEKFISYISEALRDPHFTASEQADYFEYAAEHAAQSEPKEGKEPHKVEETETLTGVVEAKRMKPVLEEYKLQPAEYLFAALSQAYLEVMGLEEAVIRNIFGGRNDARYFDTAGYFPMAIPVTVKKDSDAFANVKQAIVGSIASSTPKDDYTYQAIANHNYEYPFLMFNCLEYISQTKDFELRSLSGKNSTVAEEGKLLTPHINFYCLTQPVLGAVINLTYDPSTISKEQAQAILDRVTGKPQE